MKKYYFITFIMDGSYEHIVTNTNPIEFHKNLLNDFGPNVGIINVHEISEEEYIIYRD